MQDLEALKTRLLAKLPEAKLDVVNGALLVDAGALLAVCQALKHDEETKLDSLSNLCATDWLKEGFLEVVYHLCSVALRHGPLVMKCRTKDRADNVHIPSVTPIWRGAEYQEREAYDLYGVVFDGHPDLRRILMWDGFADFPMRKDYRPPDSYEWEPTPHGELLDRAREQLKRERSEGDAKGDAP